MLQCSCIINEKMSKRITIIIDGDLEKNSDFVKQN